LKKITSLNDKYGAMLIAEGFGGCALSLIEKHALEEVMDYIFKSYYNKYNI